VFAHIPRETLAQALDDVGSLVRPPDDVFYQELKTRYRRVRLFLPTLLAHIRFHAAPAGEPVAAALDHLKNLEARATRCDDTPLAMVPKAWQRYVVNEGGSIDQRAYTFCALDQLRAALRRRDVFVERSWRCADPRRELLSGTEWKAARPVICRTLGYSTSPGAGAGRIGR
jgi:hypothetical protein